MLLTIEDRVILLSVKVQPTSYDLAELENHINLINDWELLTENLIQSGIGPLFYKKIGLLSNKILIPEPIKLKLKKMYYKTLYMNIKFYDAYGKILSKFEEHNIQHIPLKGIYLAEWLYKDIGLRLLSDIDLLVKVSDGQKCIQLLMELGYKYEHQPVVSALVDMDCQAHYNQMFLDDILIEVHTRLQNTFESYQQNIEEIWQSVSNNQADNVKYLNLDDLLIHLCLHLDKHFLAERFQFKCFSDIVNILCFYSNQINWVDFENKCQKNKYADTVFKYLLISDFYFTVPLPKTLIDKYSFLITEEDKMRFINCLRGLENISLQEVFEDQSAVGVHILNLRQSKRISDFLKYFLEVFFPPKAFMIEKYGLVGSPVTRDVEILHKQSEVGSPVSWDVEILHKQSVVGSGQNDKLQMLAKLTSRFGGSANYKLVFWWLWYPYRWWVGVKGLISLLRSRY